MSADLVHLRVRREFRELCSGWGTLRLIEDAFDAEGFVPGPEPEEWEVSGMRRRLFDSYADVIDWQNREQVDRAMRVFEEVWSWGEGVEAEYRERELAKMLRLLDKDGYTIDDRGRIRPARLPRLAELPLEHLDDPASIEEHLGRLDPDDPPLAISSAKSLIEATCKKVLEALGEEYEERAEVPQLVKSVQMALKAHPETIAPTAKGKDTIVRVLASLSQVAIGVAELRNEYGTDHGRTRPSKGLGPRHAHLAVDAAHTYCRFLLQTLHDRLPEASQRPAP